MVETGKRHAGDLREEIEKILGSFHERRQNEGKFAADRVARAYRYLDSIDICKNGRGVEHVSVQQWNDLIERARQLREEIESD